MRQPAAGEHGQHGGNSKLIALYGSADCMSVKAAIIESHVSLGLVILVVGSFDTRYPLGRSSAHGPAVAVAYSSVQTEFDRQHVRSVGRAVGPLSRQALTHFERPGRLPPRGPLISRCRKTTR